MNLLLDTCTFLWIVSGDPRLTKRAADLFRDPNNEVVLSAVSSWEISVKFKLHRLELPEDPSTYIPEQRQRHGIEALALGESATLMASKLPDVHRDPFDRMLVCQALVGAYTLLSPDSIFRKYPVPVAW